MARYRCSEHRYVPALGIYSQPDEPFELDDAIELGAPFVPVDGAGEPLVDVDAHGAPVPTEPTVLDPPGADEPIPPESPELEPEPASDVGPPGPETGPTAKRRRAKE